MCQLSGMCENASRQCTRTLRPLSETCFEKKGEATESATPTGQAELALLCVVRNKIGAEEDFIQNRHGYCFYAIDTVCLIYNLYIHPEHRKNGHAKRIMRLVINEIRETGYTGDIEIEVKPACDGINLDGLVKLYKKMGLKLRDT